MLAALAALVFAVSTSASSLDLAKRGAPGRPGAAAFQFPPLRGWVEDGGKTGPCGGVEMGGRIDYPLSGGDLSLVLQRDCHNIQISYSLSSDPTSTSDFQPLIPAHDYSYSGSKCYSAPDFSSIGAKAGDMVTLGLSYQTGPQRNTFYQCADIRLVDAASYIASTEYTCANVTTSTQTRGSQSSSAVSNSSTGSSSSSKNDQPVSPLASGFIGAACAIVLFAGVAFVAVFAGFAKVGSRSKIAGVAGAASAGHEQAVPNYHRGDLESMTSRGSMIKA
ncbi:hypothetical protein JCM11251_007219 [Rhodosporidiobolus azoricus]